MRLDLEVDDADRMSGAAGGGRDELEPHRLQPEEDLRVHQTARVDRENPHGVSLAAHMSERRVCRLATDDRLPGVTGEERGRISVPELKLDTLPRYGFLLAAMIAELT